MTGTYAHWTCFLTQDLQTAVGDFNMLWTAKVTTILFREKSKERCSPREIKEGHNLCDTITTHTERQMGPKEELWGQRWEKEGSDYLVCERIQPRTMAQNKSWENRHRTSIFFPSTAVKRSIMQSEYWTADTWLPQSRWVSKIFKQQMKWRYWCQVYSELCVWLILCFVL